MLLAQIKANYSSGEDFSSNVESSHDESDREEKEQEDGKDESSDENGE